MAILKKDTLGVIMTGTTHVLDMAGKQAIIYYQSESDAHMLLPDGTAYSGKWRLLDDCYAVDWTDGPSGSWKLDHQAGSIAYLDSTGTRRADVSSIEFGNSRSLPR
ncbi:MAG TPA: hypothetical protein VGV39_28350 [Mesorhizobium sp.]|uniref:hypothetical protein n=1 Tax=Mesorhizobium sp. TaxID=1871066 RepID=UPI002DDCF370|nr:hypothetical protein [Mesorhizobium sp.]HEV2507015.1 hypothetical protein [Mesorhizobium sp.]